MVPPVLLLSKLNCKQRKPIKSSSILDKEKAKTTSGNTNELNINVKLEENEFEYEQTMCRICLKQGTIPIYGSVDSSNDLITFAAVEINFNDIYPKFLCGACHSMLQVAILLRKTAQQSDQILRQAREIKDDLPMHHEDLRNDFMNIEEINETFDCDEDDTVKEQTDSFYMNQEVKLESKNQSQSFCKKCDLGFNTLNKYSEPGLSSEDDKQRKIRPVCNKSYRSGNLKKHINSHTKDKSYICNICDKNIVSHKEFTRHRITHFLDNLPFQCSMCPYKGRFRESLNLHMKTHTGEKPHQCPHCPSQRFANVSDLKKHLLTHRTSPDFSCSQCQRGFLTKKALDIHFEVDHIGIKDHHEDLSNGVMNIDDIKETIDCNEDNTVEEQTDSVYRKQEVKFGNKDQSEYFCKNCDLGFNTLKEYSEHRLSLEHDNIKKVCPICNKSVKSRYLKKHLNFHTKDKSYICDVCGKNISCLTELTRHRVTHFLDNLPFECSLCPYKGRFRQSLNLHMKTHTGEKPHQCPHCPSRYFITASNLKKHLLTHKTSYDFSCTECQRGFHTKRALDMHYKVDHIGIKDHICNICGKAFGYRQVMVKHQLKVHKREKVKGGRTPLYVLLESKKRLEENNM